MSIALDRLTASERQAIATSLLVEPKPHGDDEITAHCPLHKEGTPGGAFFYNFEKDMACCMSCGQSADLVGLYNVIHGRDPGDVDGCKAFIRDYCPTDGSRPALPQSPKRPAKRDWEPKENELPPAKWSERASSFVDHSVDRLQANPERLAELASFGIDADTAARCKFGWNDQDKYVPYTSWGLPYVENGKGREKKIWLPEGLVMPAYRDGQVVKLKIRRPDPKTPWGDDRKYWEVKGGANRLYHIYGKPTLWLWVVMETERDAALVWSHCHGMGVGAMGNGGASKRPGEGEAAILRRAKVVLNALDFDAAGAENTYRFWEQEFPNAIRYPAPPSLGKDVGDAARAGLNVREWVWQGLPGYVRRALSKPASQPAGWPAKADVPARPHLETVLEQLQPNWRRELAAFVKALQKARFKVYRNPDYVGGGVWLGVEGHNWSELNRDWKRYWLFGDIKERFQAERELDPGVKTSLQGIFDQYFGDLEVCW